MNGVEAAASLFGPDDSSSDPFASLGEGGVTSPSNDVFRDYGAPQPEVQDPFAVPSGSPNKIQSEDSLSHHYASTQHDSFEVPDYGGSSLAGQQSQNWYSTEGDGNVNLQQGQSGTHFPSGLRLSHHG